MTFNFLQTFRRSFRFKVLLISILFMLVPSMSLTAFFMYQQSAYMDEALIERGRLLARVLAHSAKMGIFSESRDLLHAPVEGIARQQEVLRVAVFNAEGGLLYVSVKPGMESAGDAGATDPAIGNELLEQLRTSGSAVYFDSPDGLQVWRAVFSVTGYTGNAESLFFEDRQERNSRRAIGYIRIDMGKELLHEQVYGFLAKAVLIGAATAVAGFFLLFLVINSVTSPLNRLAGAIKALGSQGRTETVPVDTQDEIGRLAEAFNELSESLRKRNAENFQLEMQLRQAQKLEALGTLAGGIAHDFNNVLSPIFGYTEMAMEAAGENKEVYNDLKQVLKAANRARDLVRQILAFSRQSEAQKTPLHVQYVLKEAVKLLRASLPATISITEQIDVECGPIIADPTDIHRVVMNLATNAYHAMREHGGELNFVLEEETLLENDSRIASQDLAPGRYVTLSVSDTGIGMDDETLEKIFDPYFTTKPSGEGTGMGLAMVHGIVRACGGGIRVQSRPGKGSLFRIYFPRVEKESESEEKIGIQPIPHGNEHLLLVEDEVQIADMMKQMLESLGYRVTARTSSLKALEVFAASPGEFDVIVTDQTMPEMTGEELAAEAMRLRPDIPVILCTGFSEKITEEGAHEKGIRAFLMKPVLRQKIAMTIREVLGGPEA